jgi:hypothetical protein
MTYFLHMAVISIDHAITVEENSRLQHQSERSRCTINVSVFPIVAKVLAYARAISGVSRNAQH